MHGGLSRLQCDEGYFGTHWLLKSWAPAEPTARQAGKLCVVLCPGRRSQGGEHIDMPCIIPS